MNHPSTTLCAILMYTGKGIIKYLEMKHPVNDAGCIGLRGISAQRKQPECEIDQHENGQMVRTKEVDETIC
jgi:hypothetical protein